MEPTGMRKVIAEQGLEGACLYLFEVVQELVKKYEADKKAADKPQTAWPKEEDK